MHSSSSESSESQSLSFAARFVVVPSTAACTAKVRRAAVVTRDRDGLQSGRLAERSKAEAVASDVALQYLAQDSRGAHRLG